ncbi:MAG: hypothetical protein OEV01_15290, partial [Nitrospira sp.]|nr:hypothetical protein [Nitrospira sp.]
LHKMKEGMARGLVALQAPDISFYAQYVAEATDLLLNALALVERGRARIFSSQDLGWPINLLDLALCRIYESKSRAGIYFVGAQPGYEDHIFRGVLDWSAPTCRLPHALHSALESPLDDPRAIAAGVRASVAPLCDAGILASVLDQLQGAVEGKPTESRRLRFSLKQAVSKMVFYMFSETHPEYLLNIARWGASPSVLRVTGADVTHHRDTLIPLMQSVLPRITPELFFRSGWHGDEWEAFLKAMSEIPELKAVVTEWGSLLGNRALSIGAVS